MDVTFSELKQKDVINLFDGKNLGRVCDISFCFPENRVLGFTVTGSKGFKFSKQEIFIPIGAVTKIGADAVLVNFGKGEAPDCPSPKPEKCRPPKNCPPPNPPGPPPQNPRFNQNYGNPQYGSADGRRSFDEYD